MKRYFYCYIILCSMLGTMMLSCTGKKQNTDDSRHTVAEEQQVRDSSILVRLVSVRDDSIDVTYLDNRQNKTFCYGRAQMEGKVKGGLSTGDTLSILPNSQTQHVDAVINVSELVGKWFYDQAQHRGFQFGHGGALSSINMQNVSFRNWFVRNGELVIHYVDVQQVARHGQQYWIDNSSIERLDKDELVLRFRDTLYHCRHLQAPVKFRFGSK